jgi:periplasmic protein TonB
MRAYPDETMPTPRSPRSEASQELVPPRVKPTSGVETGEDRNEVDLGSIVAPILQPHPPVAEPSFAPKVARPLGSPGHWVTSDDYPARSLRERQEGLSRFRLTIGADGSHAELDQATCAKLTRRGKFNAATDGSGKSVAGSYSGAVRWKLPRDY